MSASGFWTHESVRAGVAGVWLARPDGGPALGGGAAIDTRELAPGEVFFALRGDRTDGHRFLAEAKRAGAGMAVIDDEAGAGELPQGLPVARVPDARAALARLASAYRQTLGPVRVVAVTGSNGKTTTVRMIDACLSAGLRGRCSRRSFNNDLGVPLTLLAVRPGDQYLVCEVGMNAPGEIEALSRIVRPHVAVITSVGRAHLERLGSIEAIAAEKASLAAHLEPGGLVVMPADSEHLRPYRERFERVVTFGRSPEADLRLGGVGHGPAGVSFTINGREAFSAPVWGEHNALNAAASIAVAMRLGLDAPTIRRGLEALAPAEMRLAVERLGAVTLINDAYNANPDSALAALRTLAAIAPPGARRVAVLGDMLELGEASERAHAEVAETLARERLADAAALVGALAGAGFERLRRAGVEVEAFPDASPPNAERIAAMVRPGDAVLLKASRGVRLERVAEAIRAARLTHAGGLPER